MALVIKKTVTQEITLNTPTDIVNYLATEYGALRDFGPIRPGAKVRMTARDGLAAGMASGDVGVMVLPGERTSYVLVGHETAGVMVTAVRTSLLVAL